MKRSLALLEAELHRQCTPHLAKSSIRSMLGRVPQKSADMLDYDGYVSGLVEIALAQPGSIAELMPSTVHGVAWHREVLAAPC